MFTPPLKKKTEFSAEFGKSVDWLIIVDWWITKCDRNIVTVCAVSPDNNLHVEIHCTFIIVAVGYVAGRERNNGYLRKEMKWRAYQILPWFVFFSFCLFVQICLLIKLIVVFILDKWLRFGYLCFLLSTCTGQSYFRKKRILKHD